MRPDDPVRRNPLYFWSQKLLRFALPAVFDVTYYGVENVPLTGGALIAANHQSYLDPPLVGTAIDRPVSYLAKSQLFENSHFGGLIRALHAVPVRQGRGDRAAMVECIERVKAGNLLCLFPEGSRSETGEIEPLQAGLSLIIRRAEVPVVPAVIDGSCQAWPKGAMLPHPHPIKVMYGRPLSLHDLPPAEITRVLERRLKDMFDELRAFPLGASGAPTFVSRGL